jgi:CheY-like chemotaxis protein
LKPFEGVTIIIAEDEELLREILRDEFEYYGAKVIDCANGKIAMQQHQLHNADIIISDVRMPQGDGLELLEKLKVMGKLPIFYFSTAYTDISEEEARQRGARGLFSKPYELKLLMDALKADIENKRNQAA